MGTREASKNIGAGLLDEVAYRKRKCARSGERIRILVNFSPRAFEIRSQGPDGRIHGSEMRNRVRIVTRLPRGVVHEAFGATGPTGSRSNSAPPETEPIQIPAELANYLIGSDRHLGECRGGSVSLDEGIRFPIGLVETDATGCTKPHP